MSPQRGREVQEFEKMRWHHLWMVSYVKLLMCKISTPLVHICGPRLAVTETGPNFWTGEMRRTELTRYGFEIG